MLNEEYYTLEQLKEGSLPSFEKLYGKYSGKLYNYIFKLSNGNGYLAEELVQRTFIKIWEKREQIDPARSFISFITTIAKNLLLNEVKHETVEYIYREYLSKYSRLNDTVTEKQLDSELLDRYIEKLTEELPPARRQIFILSRRDMLSNKEIAQKLNITESTIQTQLSKALAFMKKNLEDNAGYTLILTVLLFLG